MRRERGALRLSLSLLPLLSGCALAELATGQLALINEQRRLDRAIAEERDPVRRSLLAEVPEVRRFAEEVLSLQPGRSYAGYFATEREGMTYVLTASERYRLSAYSWWFPIAGDIEYRSYYDKRDAERAARELEARGYDTWIAPSKAYSTLGFFRDPVTTTMMRDGLPAFVEVLLHEMTHARLYAPGRTEWNEALASFVGEVGAERYFARARFAGTPFRDEMKRRTEAKRKLEALTLEAYGTLERVYASGRSREHMDRERRRVFSSLSQAMQQLFPAEAPERLRMNNARLVHLRRYGASHAQMRGLWRRSGGSFRRFFRLAEDQAERGG